MRAGPARELPRLMLVGGINAAGMAPVILPLMLVGGINAGPLKGLDAADSHHDQK